MGIATMVMALGSDYDASRALNLKMRIGRIDGVDFVDFNYTNNKVIVRFDSDRVSPKELEDIVSREKKHRARSITKTWIGGA